MWKSKKKLLPFQECTIHSINSIVNQFANLPKESKLSIGDHFQHDYITIDFMDADFCGDVRWIWRRSDFTESPQLLEIPKHHFKFIKVQHFIEHIEWIYQQELFEWIKELLADDGTIYIVTPNLEFIIDVYYNNLLNLRNGKTEFKFPLSDHPDLKQGTYLEYSKWVNYKIFSGCSPFDHHSCLYDKQSIYEILNKLEFYDLKINSSDVLSVVASRKEMINYDYNAKLEEIVNG